MLMYSEEAQTCVSMYIYAHSRPTAFRPWRPPPGARGPPSLAQIHTYTCTHIHNIIYIYVCYMYTYI